mgnify:CR=1 FL=1
MFLPIGENLDPPEPNLDPRMLRLMEERQALLDQISDIEFILEAEYERVF